MGGESLNSPEKLKEYMDSLFDFSTKLPYQKFHLITTLQASKSLIGINPNNPPKTILKWIESYISTFTIDFEDEKQKNDKVKLEVITIEKFTSAVSKNEKLLALDYIEHLFQVASPQYLSEYILELSLGKSISHTLFCWYIYKSLKNIKYEGQLHLLKLGVSALFDSSLNLKDSEFIILCVFREILDTIYIRFGTFSSQLLTLLEAARKKCEQKGSYYLEKKIEPFIISDPESGLYSYLSTLNENELSSDIIIQLDALRSIMKYSPKEQGFTYKDIINNSLDYNA